MWPYPTRGTQASGLSKCRVAHTPLTRGCGISTDRPLLRHIVGRALKQPAHEVRTPLGRTHKFDPGAPSLTRPKAWITASAHWNRQVQKDKAASRYCDAHRRDDLICSECSCCAMLCRWAWHNCFRWLDGARKAIWICVYHIKPAT